MNLRMFFKQMVEKQKMINLFVGVTPLWRNSQCLLQLWIIWGVPKRCNGKMASVVERIRSLGLKVVMVPECNNVCYSTGSV